MSIQTAIKNSKILDVADWRSICDLTLTLKQARKTADGRYFQINRYQCEQAFEHFLNLLNCAVYKNAVRRHGKKLRVISVMEKDIGGRWHIHAAIEPPIHLDSIDFEKLVRKCWERVDWGYREIVVRSNTDKGWIDYMLKPSQKTGFEAWS